MNPPLDPETAKDLKELLWQSAHPPKVKRGEVRRNRPLEAVGLLVQVAGVLLFFAMGLFPINVVVAPFVIVAGGALARVFECDQCGMRVKRRATRCPRCEAEFR